MNNTISRIASDEKTIARIKTVLTEREMAKEAK